MLRSDEEGMPRPRPLKLRFRLVGRQLFFWKDCLLEIFLFIISDWASDICVWYASSGQFLMKCGGS